MSVILKSGSSSNVATVDTNGNLGVNLPLNPQLAGCVRILDTNNNAILTTDAGAFNVSVGDMIFWDQVDGTTIDLRLWNPLLTGSGTAAVANGFIQTASSTVANSSAVLQSIGYIPMYSFLPLQVAFVAMSNTGPIAGLTMELGLGSATGTSAPTDGMFFRWNPNGTFQAVVNNGGSETAIVITAPTTNACHLFQLQVVENAVMFYIDDSQVAIVNNPSGNPFPTNNGRQPVLQRSYTGSSGPASSGILSVGQYVIQQSDVNQNRSWSETLATQGAGAHQSPVTPYQQTANKANSSAPTSATLSNTAAGYTTFGGQFQFAAPAGAATDYALFGFQVPASKRLFINSIAISTANTGAIGGLTGTLLEWSIGIDSSAVSLATTDSAGIFSPRRLPLGMQSFGISAAIGFMPPDISRRFDTPVIVNSGRFLHVILQVPLGLATTSQIFRGAVFLNAYFE